MSWSRNDAGSGIATYDIFVSADGAESVLWLDDTTGTTATYKGEAGHTYAFYSVTRDNVGYIEAVPVTADTQITVTATSGNNSPTLSNISKTGNEDNAIGFTLAEFTNAFSDPDSNSLSKIQVKSLPVNGALKLNGTDISLNQEIPVAELDNFTFTPVANFNGNTSLTWNGFDGTTYANSDAAININVAAVNDAPTLENAIANQAAIEDTIFSFTFNANTFSDVDANDSLNYNATLADGNPLPSWLSLDAATRTFSRTPTNSNVGILSLKVTATDTAGSTSEDNFDIEVVNVNDPPVAVNDIATTDQNTPLTILTPTLLANNSDIDGNLSITAVSNATNGNVVFDTEQDKIVFTPALNFSGAASFSYTVSDGNSGTSTATVAVTVNPFSELNQITGTSERDVLTGTSNSDRIIGLQGADILTGSGGDDQFVYTSIRDRGDTITDFEVGKDTIFVTQLFDSLVTEGYKHIDAIADGYVKVVQGSSASNFSVQIDADGFIGGDIFLPFITVNLAGTGTLNNPSNFVF